MLKKIEGRRIVPLCTARVLDEMAELSFEPCITSVKDEIAKIHARKRALLELNHCSQVGGSGQAGAVALSKADGEQERAVPSGEGDEGREGSEVGSGITDSTSGASGATGASTGSSCTRARKGDIYTLAPDEEIQRIVAEIDAGRFVSNTKCAPWGPGQKHHPCGPDTLRVRLQLHKGSSTKEQLCAALPLINKKLINSILHELREQGIVTVTRPEKVKKAK